MSSIPFPKIDSIFKRNMDGDKKFILGAFCDEATEYLRNNNWDWTVKIDGTNMRAHFDPEVGKVEIGGRTDNAQIPAPLYNRMTDIFDPLVPVLAEKFPTPVTFYGEGYGAGIQKGGKYGPVDFICFDILHNDNWWKRDALEGFCGSLGIEVVPLVGTGSIWSAIEWVETGLAGMVDREGWENIEHEGLVGKPSVTIYNRHYSRIITKIKKVDFTT